MKNNIFNFIKFGKNVDINSIEFFHTCLEYNTKIQPKINDELLKWPIYQQYWELLIKKNLIEPFIITTSYDQIKISGDFIKNPLNHKNNDKVIFLLHGITNTKFWLFKQAYVFLTSGYNVVWYDARNHGNSDVAPTTFGKNESSDLQDVINYISEKYPIYQKYLLYGYSMGGATILLWSSKINENDNNKKIKAVIADSTYAHFQKSYQEKINEHSYLPSNILINMFQKQAEKNIGPNALEILKPINYLKNMSNIPVIFIHGINDRFVNFTNSEEMYREKVRYENPIRSKLFLVNSANHGQSFLVGDNYPNITDEYDQTIFEPISKLVIDWLDENID